MMGSMGEMMGFGWWGAALWMNLLLAVGLFALVPVTVVAGIRWLAQSGAGVGDGRGTDRALEILRERYARGEVSREEFQQRRRGLSRGTGA
jgi:putative membrane protein